MNYIEIGEREGATLIRDGRKDESAQAGGYFVGPTIFDNVTSEMKIWQDEIFAPVLSVSRVKGLDEAIALANNSRFANGACIFTNHGGNVRKFRETIDAGMLGLILVYQLQWHFSHSLAGRILSMVIYMQMGKTG